MKLIMVVIILSVVTFICVFSAYYFTKTKPKKVYKQTQIEKIIMSTPKELEELKKIKALYEFIENIDINESSKKLILNKVKFELEYIERKVFLSLGEDEYNKICGIKEKDRK